MLGRARATLAFEGGSNPTLSARAYPIYLNLFFHHEGSTPTSTPTLTSAAGKSTTHWCSFGNGKTPAACPTKAAAAVFFGLPSWVLPLSIATGPFENESGPFSRSGAL